LDCRRRQHKGSTPKAV